jgi:hypothetical protein
MINPPADVLSELWHIARDEFNDAFFSSTPGFFFTLAFIPYPEETIAAGVANGRNMLGIDRQVGSNNTYLNGTFKTPPYTSRVLRRLIKQCIITYNGRMLATMRR